MMIAPAPSWLETLEEDAIRANAAEDAFRREIVARTKELERQRAFAFRRFNLMRAVAEAIARVDSEETAIAHASATLRARLGWASDSEARTVALEHFAPVAQAIFEGTRPQEGETASQDGDRPPDVRAALQAFEDWYAATHPIAFWVLFENVMPETPLVDF